MAIRPFANAPHADRNGMSANWLIGVQTGNTPNDVNQMKYLTLDELTSYVRSTYGSMWNYRGSFGSETPTDPMRNDYFVCTDNFTDGSQSFVSGHIYAYNGNTWDDVSNVFLQYVKQGAFDTLSEDVDVIDDRLTEAEQRIDAMTGMVFKGDTTRANLPTASASNQGWVYYLTDESIYVASNGTQWVTVMNYVVQTITEGDTTHAPSGNAVYNEFETLHESIKTLSEWDNHSDTDMVFEGELGKTWEDMENQIPLAENDATADAAEIAIKARQDKDGNDIVETYALKADVSTLEDRTDTVESDIITLKDATDSLGAEDIDQQRRISELEFDVMDLQSALSGFTEVEFKRETSGGTFDIPTPERGTLANSAEVMKVMGESITSDNLWNEQWELGSISDANGQNVTNGTTIRTKSGDYIPVQPNTVYFALGYIKVYFYDANGNYLSVGGWKYNATFTTPSNCYKMRFFVDNSYGTTYKNDIAIIKGTSGSYSPYFEGIRDSSNITVSAVSRNLFNKSTIKRGFYLNNNGEEVSSSGYSVSDFIKIEGGASYFFTDRSSIRTMWYDSSKTVINAGSWGTSTSGATVASAPINASYVRVSVGEDKIDSCMVVKSAVVVAEYTPYHIPSYLTIPVSLKKGDEYEPSTGDVVENMDRVDLGSLRWVEVSGECWQSSTSIEGIAKPSSNTEVYRYPFLLSKYSLTAESASGRWYENSFSVTTDGRIQLNIGMGATPAGELLYTLATPTSRHLTDPILNNLPVWEGGQISVTSDGAQAEVTMSFLLNYSVDTRLQELEEKVTEQQKTIENHETRIKTQEYANEGRTYIMEESQRDGYTVDVKPATVTGEAFGEAVLKSMEGRDVCWNQLINVASLSPRDFSGIVYTPNASGVISVVGTASAVSYMQVLDRPSADNHKYLVLGCPNGGSDSTYMMRVSDQVGATVGFDYGNGFIFTNSAGFTVFLRVVAGQTVNVVYKPRLVDLTQMFPTDTPTTLTDPRIADLKAYLAEHPEYNEGTIVNNAVTSVVSGGRNLADPTIAKNQGWTVSGDKYTVNSAYANLRYVPIHLESGQTITVSATLQTDVRTYLCMSVENYSTEYRGLVSGAGRKSYTFTCTVSGDYYPTFYTIEGGSQTISEIMVCKGNNSVYTPFGTLGTLTLPSICAGLHGLPSASDKVSFVNRVYENMKTYTFTGNEAWRQGSNAWLVDFDADSVRPATDDYVANVLSDTVPNVPVNRMNDGGIKNGIGISTSGKLYIGAETYANRASLTGKTIHYEATSGGQRYEARVLERKTGKLILKGTEEFGLNRTSPDTTVFTTGEIYTGAPSGENIEAVASFEWLKIGYYSTAKPNTAWMYDRQGRFAWGTPNQSDATAFKAYLANLYAQGNPFTVIYPLATPQLLDVTDLVPEEPSLPIEDGGTLTFVNENRVATPFTMSMPVKLGGTV